MLQPGYQKTIMTRYRFYHHCITVNQKNDSVSFSCVFNGLPLFSRAITAFPPRASRRPASFRLHHFSRKRFNQV
jgi:hypothetical protein